MRCSDVPLGGGSWSGRGADAPSFFCAESWLLQPTAPSPEPI